jgi:hypothetical protein
VTERELGRFQLSTSSAKASKHSGSLLQGHNSNYGRHIRSDDHNLPLTLPHHSRFLLPYFPRLDRRPDTCLHNRGSYGDGGLSAKANNHLLTVPSQPYARSFEDKSQPLSFLAALLFVVGITDLVSVSLPEEIAQYHWGSQG